MKSRPPLLFWVSAPDHQEDQFVLAATAMEAAAFHQNYIGCDLEGVCAERLEAVDETGDSPSYAERRTLLRLGYKSVARYRPVIFAKHGRIFIPGDICYRLFLAETARKSGVYVVEAVGTRQFKIGVTSNLEARLRKLQTGNPYRLRARMFVQCERPRHLEFVAHQWLSDERQSQEWFLLSSKEYRALRHTIWGLTKRSAEFKIADYDCFPRAFR